MPQFSIEQFWIDINLLDLIHSPIVFIGQLFEPNLNDVIFLFSNRLNQAVVAVFCV